MKTYTVERFKCETCGHDYTRADEAAKCESRPISQDKGVKVGDTVRIIRGDGLGRGIVEERFILSKDWGHYAWERYWHTVALVVKCQDSWGHRQLTFDDYEAIKPQ